MAVGPTRVLNQRTLGIFGHGNPVTMVAMSNVTDGTSNTIMVGEVHRGVPFWRSGDMVNITGLRCHRWIAETAHCGADTSYPPNNFKNGLSNCSAPTTGPDNADPTMYQDCPTRNCCPDVVAVSDFYNYGNTGRRPLSSLHPGGVQGAYGDGSVKFITERVDVAVWRATGTRRGQESTVYTGE
jgi:hypothetical protein